MRLIIASIMFIALVVGPPLDSFTQNQKATNKETTKEKDNDLPPFKYPCKSSFTEIGAFVKSTTIKEIFIEAKHYNFENNACMFALNEYMYNIVPPLGITELNVYILDTLGIKTNQNWDLLTNVNLKRKVVAVLQYNVLTGKTEFKYDPFDFGLYKGPKEK